MTVVHRWPYRPGDRVLVEGVVLGCQYGESFGEVTVRFAEATDPTHLLDGVDVVAPQVLVTPHPSVDVPNGYVAIEGFYEDEESKSE